MSLTICLESECVLRNRERPSRSASAWAGCCPVRRRRACRSCSARWPAAALAAFATHSRGLGHVDCLAQASWICDQGAMVLVLARPSILCRWTQDAKWTTAALWTAAAKEAVVTAHLLEDRMSIWTCSPQLSTCSPRRAVGKRLMAGIPGTIADSRAAIDELNLIE